MILDLQTFFLVERARSSIKQLSRAKKDRALARIRAPSPARILKDQAGKRELAFFLPFPPRRAAMCSRTVLARLWAIELLAYCLPRLVAFSPSSSSRSSCAEREREREETNVSSTQRPAHIRTCRPAREGRDYGAKGRFSLFCCASTRSSVHAR